MAGYRSHSAHLETFCTAAKQRGRRAHLFGWKERPFTLLDLVSNFVNWTDSTQQYIGYPVRGMKLNAQQRALPYHGGSLRAHSLRTK